VRQGGAGGGAGADESETVRDCGRLAKRSICAEIDNSNDTIVKKSPSSLLLDFFAFNWVMLRVSFFQNQMIETSKTPGTHSHFIFSLNQRVCTH
jgi:hypothetical protein